MTPLGELIDPALVQRLNQLDLISQQVADGSAGGSRQSIRHGASIEFGEHRAFAPGDEPRRIDWRLLARSGKLFVREDRQETIARVLLALDCSGSMSYGRLHGSKLRYAQRFLAALAYLLLSRREAVGLATFSGAIEQWLPIAASSTQLSMILDALVRGGGRTTGDAARAMAALADRLTRRCLIVIASDLLLPVESINSALARLRHGHHEVLLLRVLDPDELEFPFNKPTQFAGLEQERPRLRNAGLLRRDYLRRFGEHADQLRRICDRHHVTLYTLSTGRPLDEAVIGLLTRRMHFG